MSNFDQRDALRWLLALVGFVSVAWCSDYALTYGVIANSETIDAARIVRLTKNNPGESPVFGASKAQANYIPEYLGLSSFNYGMGAASFEVVDAFLKIELKKQSTAPVILDMHHHSFHGIGDPTKFIPHAHRPEIRTALQRDGSMKWRYLLPGFRYFGHYDSFLKDFVNEQCQITRRTECGYTHVLNPLPQNRELFELLVQRRLSAPSGFRSDPDHDERLIRHIKSAPHRHFIIVFSPLHGSWFEHFTGEDEFAKYIDELDSFANVSVLNMLQLPFPDEYFLDTGHLNETGAKEFSLRLGVEIRKVLDDRSTRFPSEVAERSSQDTSS